MNKLENRAVEASAAYFRTRGYDVLDVMPAGGAVKIVARDGETDDIVFASVQVRQSASEPAPPEPQRGKLEAEACEWLAGHETLGRCRFDALLLTVANGERALVRHHVDCLACDGL